MSLSERLQPDLVSVRNKAVHTGGSISIEQAWAAVRVARETVNNCEPLDAHCDESLQSCGSEAMNVDHVDDPERTGPAL